MIFHGVVLFAGLALLQTEPAAAPGRLISAAEPGWPQWRGPRRDGISDEKGLLAAWPAGGPAVLWSVSGIGTGYSAPVLARGTLFITGDAGDDLQVLALDTAGKPRWSATNGRAWKGEYPGARASCAFDDGRLYHMNAHGRVACFDATTGRELWAVDVLERFEGRNITWGMSENLLVDGPRVVVTPGGKKGVIAALDKKTGDTIWAAEPLLHDRGAAGRVADGPGYASPILFEMAGRRHLVTCSTRHVIGADADTGRILWSRPMPTPYDVLSLTPVLCGDGVFYTAPFTDGGRLYRLRAKGSGVDVEEAWTTRLDSCHGGALLVDGLLLGSGYQKVKGWSLLDVRTGESLHHLPNLAMGAAVWADGRFYCLSQEGVMALVRADRQGLAVVSEFRPFEGRKRDVWAHPVILDGRLYLRHHDTLTCYDIK